MHVQFHNSDTNESRYEGPFVAVQVNPLVIYGDPDDNGWTVDVAHRSDEDSRRTWKDSLGNEWDNVFVLENAGG